MSALPRHWRAAMRLFALAGVLLQGCTALPPRVDAPVSLALPANPDAPLARVAALSVPAGADSAVRALPISALAMDARLTLVRNARHSLDLQYYLLRDDASGHKLLRALRDAALRGVRVRLLVDDLYSADSRDLLEGLAAYANVQVRLFNPFAAGREFAATRFGLALLDFTRINHRMHNKLFIADGAFAIAGGRNIGDEYFAFGEQPNFIDFDLLLAGAAVPQLAAIFDEYWNSQRAFPLRSLDPPSRTEATRQDAFERRTADAQHAFATPGAEMRGLLGYRPLSADLKQPPLRLLAAKVAVFADDPEKVSGRSEDGSEVGSDSGTVTARVVQALIAARFEWVLGSPYFIPNKAAMQGIREARERGVQVVVITNSPASNDEPFAGAAYARRRLALLKMGVELYEIDATVLASDPLFHTADDVVFARMHAKLLVIDRHLTFAGSMNLDLRSARLNTELGLLVDSPELAAQVLELAAAVRSRGSYRVRLDPSGQHVQWVLQRGGREIVYDSEPAVGPATWLELQLFSPLVSDDLL